MPCPLTWHSVLVAAPAATPFLCRRNAAVPGMSRCKCNSCKRRHRPRWARVQKVHLRIARALPSTNTFALTARRGLGRPYPGRRSLRSLCPGLGTNPPTSGLGRPSAFLLPVYICPISINTCKKLPSPFAIRLPAAGNAIASRW